MKIQRYLAVLLVALMATTVVSAAGVLTAPKAAATPAYLPITYVEGKTYTFAPSQCNYHTTDPLRVFAGHPLLLPVSSGSKVVTMVRTDAQSAGRASANIGYRYGLTDFTQDDLDNPCTVTMQVRYTLAVRGGTDASAFATGWPGGDYYYIKSGDPVLVKTVTTTITYTNTVGVMFGDTSAVPGARLGSAQAYVISASYEAGSAASVTTTAEILGLTIEFPTS